jgi:hypothetical protein
VASPSGEMLFTLIGLLRPWESNGKRMPPEEGVTNRSAYLSKVERRHAGTETDGIKTIQSTAQPNFIEIRGAGSEIINVNGTCMTSPL